MLTMSKKILVVEDDETMRSTLAALLRCEGFEVLTARNGEDGYHQATSAQAIHVRAVTEQADTKVQPVVPRNLRLS